MWVRNLGGELINLDQLWRVTTQNVPSAGWRVVGYRTGATDPIGLSDYHSTEAEAKVAMNTLLACGRES